MMKKNLDLENIEQLLKQALQEPNDAAPYLHSDWALHPTGIERTFAMTNFQDGLLFVTRVAFVAERAGHHPDVTLRYQDVTLRWVTHDQDTLTWADVALARAVDGLDATDRESRVTF